MDFLSLSSEFESHKDYINLTSQTMNCLLNFFTQIQTNLNTYISSSSTCLTELILNLTKYDPSRVHIKKCLDFFRFFEKYLSKLSLVSKKIYLELISPTNEFNKYLSDENYFQLGCLEEMIVKTISQKKKYEKTKRKYFDICKQAEKQEKKLLEVMNRASSSEEQINNQNKILTQLRIESQEECQKYKEEHKITNEIYEENNRKYFPLLSSLKDNEEKRINHLSFHLEKFVTVLTEHKNLLTEVIEQMSENSRILNNSYSVNNNNDLYENNKDENINKSNTNDNIKDIEIYQNQFNFVYKPGVRFIMEEFLLYDIYRRNIESLVNSANKIFSENNKHNPIFTPKLDSGSGSLRSLGVRMFNCNPEMIDLNLEQNDKIVYRSIFDTNPLNVNPLLFQNFENKLRNDSKFVDNILKKMLNEYFSPKVVFYKFRNEEQFKRLCQVLVHASLNNEIRNKISDLNFGIIYIAEKTFLLNENNQNNNESSNNNDKKYLCRELSDRCGLFKEKNFWKKLIEYKINFVFNKYFTKAKNDEKKLKSKDSDSSINSTSMSNSNISSSTPTHKKKVIKNLQKGVKFLIDIGTGANAKNNAKIKEIKERNKLDVRYKELINIVKDFSIHFANFNLDMTISNDIIMEIGTEFQLDKDEIIFLVSHSNSNMYSVKSGNNGINNESTINISIISSSNENFQKNQNINVNNINKSIISQNKKRRSISININKNKNSNKDLYENNFLTKKIYKTNNVKLKHLYLILNSCFMFLEPKDFVSLKSVNKFYYQNSEKIIYKHIFLKSYKTNTELRKSFSLSLTSSSSLIRNSLNNLKTESAEVDIDKHIGMWFNFLKYNPNDLDYFTEVKKLGNPLEEVVYEKMSEQYIDTINLDVVRTFFEKDQENKRKKIRNILIILAVKYPSVGYCQGMNYLCQFLLEATGGDEKKTFDVFSCLISKTVYPELFLNNFEKMKTFFYVFERLINLYLPDIHTVVKKNNIHPSFYISPWFITLFSQSFCYGHNKILLRVLDMFVLDGWISIIRIGLVLLKKYRNDIIEMKFEELLQFLINDLKEKYDFFKDYNYDRFVEMYREMKVTKGLVNNIENEYDLYKKVEKIKQDYLDSNGGVDTQDAFDEEDDEENNMDI